MVSTLGLNKIELLNHEKIKSVYINTGELDQLVMIQAPTLEHLTFEGEKFEIVEHQNLNSLDISHMRICDGFLHNIISGSQSLKELKIRFCGGITEIDCSNLESLEYMGYKISGELKHLIFNHYVSGNLNAEWFYNLRKFPFGFTTAMTST